MIKNKEEDIIGNACVTILVALFIFGFTYLVHSFYAESFNISDWTKDCRLSCAIIGGYASFIVGVFTWIGLHNYSPNQLNPKENDQK